MNSVVRPEHGPASVASQAPTTVMRPSQARCRSRHGAGRGAVLLALSGLMALGMPARAQGNEQPLPGSMQTNYFLFKLASSLQLSDVQTGQCDASSAELAQTARVTTSHSFVLPENANTLQTTLDSYAQASRFLAEGGWVQDTRGSYSRRFIDPDVQGYRYAVALYPLGGSTALCVSVLGVE